MTPEPMRQGKRAAMLETSIAEAELPLSEARSQGEEACHWVPHPLHIHDILTQHHEPSAFAVNEGAALGRPTEPIGETDIPGELSGVELRIAAGEENGIS